MGTKEKTKKKAKEEIVETPAIDLVEEKAEKKVKEKGALRMLKGKRGASLIVSIVLELVIPYAYLMLCGLVVDWWLHLYQLTTFVFFSYVVLQVLGVVAAIITICKRKRK